MFSNSSWETADEMAQLIQILGEAPPELAPAARRFYQPELDGLRFYAFLGVFVYHTLPSQALFYRRLHLPLPGLWGAVAKSGASGVDLFFALSAFLITSLLLRERQDTGDISLRLFYLRRILRIWPLYFAVLALGVVLAHTMTDQRLPWYYVAGYLLFIGNWVSAVFGHTQSVCSPLWTVSIEEQFYLVWPALMKKLARRGMIIAATLTFLLATLSQAGIVLAGLSGGYIYYGSTSRCGSLALGILLALFACHLPTLRNTQRWLLVGVGLASWIAASAWLIDQPGPVSMRMVLGRMVVSLASVAILYGSLHSQNQLLRGHWVVQLGKRSYGLYMLHLTGILILQSLLRPAWGWQLLATKALGLAMTVILAFAPYRWIESPFLRRKDRFATVLSRPV
jgi:peptidoglycan/LPS O-acetylase OafA/YrhL